MSDATGKGIESKDDLPEHSPRESSREAEQTSDSDRATHGGEKHESQTEAEAPTEAAPRVLSEFLAELPERDPRLIRAERVWTALLEPGQPVHIPGAMADFARVEVDAERARCLRLAGHHDSVVYPGPRDAIQGAIADMRECVCPNQCPRHGPAKAKP